MQTRGKTGNMKILFFVIAGILAWPACATTWHVSPSGKDSYTGSSARPFATWQRAVSVAVPGDTIVLRPGHYVVTTARSYGARITRSGSSSAPITMRSEGGRAILDCSRMNYRSGVYCLDLRANWWRISGIDVTGAKQVDGMSWSLGVLVRNSSHNVLDDVASYDHAGVGLRIEGRSGNNLIKNCDVHDNFDDKTAGGNADGISVGVVAGAAGNRIMGCRTWANSDDGLDLWLSEAPVSVTGSWAFWNGYVPGSSEEAGDGVGFKLGRNMSGPRHSITLNLAFENRYTGFDSNGVAGGINIFNNVAANNGAANFVFSEKLPHFLYNNIAFGGIPNWLNSGIMVKRNSWNLYSGGAVVSDFQSIATDGVTDDREVDGSLPILPFMRLAANRARMIDQGLTVGLSYVGSAPDLGAYEYAPTS